MSIDQTIPARLISKAILIGADPADDDELRLRRSILVITSIMISIAAIIWGFIYVAFDERLAGFIPLSYSIISMASLLYLGLSRRYHFFRFVQLTLILLLPFFLMLSLGGFTSGSAVVLWSLLCPLGAMLVCENRLALRWFLIYLVLVVLSGLLNPIIDSTNNLPSAVVTAFFVMNIGAVSAIAFTLLYYFVAQKDRVMGLLSQEQVRSERLLLNVLPAEIAAILKVENRTIADRHDSVSILFADVVDFTPLSAELAPEEMVHLLNEVFSFFDSLVDKYGLEKIRTIGDNYMVASGVPRSRPDHAQALARMALEMIEYMDQSPSTEGMKLCFRIGINSGPVVAGVIGQRKFHYDVWGDPVNIASRMESQGAPGKIQITDDTYQLIENEFICKRRGEIMIKGKGKMTTWYLEGLRDAAAAPAPVNGVVRGII